MKLISFFLAVVTSMIFLSMPLKADSPSWWEKTFGTAPNLEANAIYAPNFSRSSTYADMESVLFIKKINGNPINFSVLYVPSTDIGGVSIGYELNNLPQNTLDMSLLSVFDVTLSVGVAYDGSINKASLTFGARILKISFK